jgi:phosphate transport system substrate-binding protein
MKYIFLFIILFANICGANDQIRIIGSSTIYPFITTIVEKFGKSTDFKTPIVESTGTGGGINLFCTAKTHTKASIVMASRKMLLREINLCNKHDIKNITEIKLGYDGIILASSKKFAKYNLTSLQLYLALAEKLMINNIVIDNPYKKWSDIDPALPDKVIEIYGPSINSGTRSDFEEVIMHKPCNQNNYRFSGCKKIRSDKHFIEMGDNDNLLIQKLALNNHALGIFGYNFLIQNSDIIHAASLDNIVPNPITIKTNQYNLSRALYIYINDDLVKDSPSLKAFLKFLNSKKVIASGGYLSKLGLISLNNHEINENIKLLAKFY